MWKVVVSMLLAVVQLGRSLWQRWDEAVRLEEKDVVADIEFAFSQDNVPATGHDDWHHSPGSQLARMTDLRDVAEGHQITGR